MAEVFKVVAMNRGKVVSLIKIYTVYLRARLTLRKLNEFHYNNPEQCTFAIIVERE
jgi:hypothetical protein